MPNRLEILTNSARCQAASCPKHRFSHLIDIVLKPFLQHTSSYVRNDIDFLTKHPSQLKESKGFVMFDVTILYSNIAHVLGSQAIEYWLQTYAESLYPRISKALIKIIL